MYQATAKYISTTTNRVGRPRLGYDFQKNKILPFKYFAVR